MARKAKPEIAKPSELIEALSFVAAADTGKDIDKYAYVTMQDNTIVASNDVFAMGAHIDDDVRLCLHGAKLKAALENCGTNFQLTQLDASSVSIKSGKFKATIPCIDPELLTKWQTDPVVAVISDTIKDCFALLHPLVSEKSDRTIDHALHLRPFTGVGTNGGLLFEYYHGHDLPPGLLIPKQTAAVLAKLKPKLHGLGFSKHSATFWFDNNSYLRTKLIDGTYPDTDRLWYGDYASHARSLPTGFYQGLEAIEKFVDNDSVYFVAPNYVSTHPSLNVGANYIMEEALPAGLCYSMNYWKRTRDLVNHVIWPPDHSKPAQLFGANLRALILGKQG